jgi:predicted acyltransferase
MMNNTVFHYSLFTIRYTLFRKKPLLLLETAEQRLVSLDVFRGMTIAGMVLVKQSGNLGIDLRPLKHAEWHGITPTDYIFPFFLFIVGVAIPIALSKRIEAGITRDVYYKIISRSF